MHIISMFKQYKLDEWHVFILYKHMKNIFHMTIIAKLWSMKFVMNIL
jgi:phage-related protein